MGRDSVSLRLHGPATQGEGGVTLMKNFFCIAVFLLLAGPAFGQNVDLGTDEQREAGRALYIDKCAHCHREGGIGPFAMDSYAMVRGWSAMMREVLMTRRMPRLRWSWCWLTAVLRERPFRPVTRPRSVWA